MSTESIKLQTGDLTPSNRLNTEQSNCEQAQCQRPNSLDSGHRACQGCGEALGARIAIDTAIKRSNNKVMVANATGCLEVFSTPYPESAWTVPWIHSLFANAPSVATGIAAALKAKGKTDVTVIGQGGDGSTVDIGFGALSGMFDRNDDVLFICYDNEAYMNTGVQRSARTPVTARTATTPLAGSHPGALPGQGKNAPAIAIAHNIPYVATCSVADIRDIEEKVTKALTIRGSKYLHIHVPCPLGWGSATSDTILLARLAVESGLYPVYEAEHGAITHCKKIRKLVPVDEYLKRQKRFSHLFKDASGQGISAIQAIADHNIEQFNLVGAAK